MLQKFLNSKPLYYNEVDYDRMPRVFSKIKSNFKLPKIIHIVGTNGKGTTGRFLAFALHAKGFRVGHYTSPHILKFNERIWINGSDVSDEILENAHQKLQLMINDDDLASLSYFEYTTFLAMLVFKDCEFVVLEAGLGGEGDATSVFEHILSIVTVIDYDHQDFLGKSIKEIASTKLNAVQKKAIVAKQKHKEVIELAKLKKIDFVNVDEIIEKKDIEIAKSLKLPKYLQDNLLSAISALKILGIDYDRESFVGAKMFGRMEKIKDNIIVDVGHNALAAHSLKETLYPKKYVLIYNTYKDKEYKKILAILKPIIKKVEILDINLQRIEEIQKLEAVLGELNILYGKFKKIQQEENYLVFGSFSVVERFLEVYNG